MNEYAASEDASERWYQLIQSSADLTLMARSLRDRAARLRADAKLRKRAGPLFEFGADVSIKER